MLDLALFERDAEAFSRAVGREHYLHAAGWQATLDLTSAYDDFRHLFREETYGELLEAEAEPKPKRYLIDFVVTGYLGDRTKGYTERLAALEAATTVEWDGQQLPYRGVAVAIANEPDAHRRHELAARQRIATATFNPLYEERHRALLAGAPELGRGDYVALYDEQIGRAHV